MRLIFLVSVCLSGLSIAVSTISLTGNGYTDVLVTVADDIAENTQLISILQDWLIEASRKLYIASKYRFFFEKVIIRIPEAWSNNGQYIVTSASTNREGDIRIENPIQDVRSNPYACCLPACGVGGQYIHFTTDVMFKGENAGFGNLATVLVHEWGHYRWGLFDEYPTSRDTYTREIIRFYSHNGRWEPVRCTTEIFGTIFNYVSNRNCRLDSRGKPESDCIFRPEYGVKATAIASMMGSAYIKSISQFCDSNSTDERTKHNSEAPNKHNDKCSGQSSWDIIKQHNDYKATSPGSPFANTRPQIILQQTQIIGRFCLLVDVSGSMQNFIGDAKDALTTVIKTIIPNESYVGIASFNDNGQLLKRMTKITSESDRNSLAYNLPTTTDGSTSIGAGIETCYQELLTLHNVTGSVIYLATDGKENKSPYIEEVLPNLTGKGIVLHTLAIGSSADEKLNNISKMTGGSSYFYSTNTVNSTSLVDALMEPFTDSSKDKIIRIKTLHTKILTQQVFETNFVIDDTIGKDTIVQLTTHVVRDVNLTIKHSEMTFAKIGTAGDNGVIYIKIPGIAQIGKYDIFLSSTTHDISGTLSIFSKAVSAKQAVLQVNVLNTEPEIQYSAVLRFPLYAAVYKGSMPVINAAVKAVIENEIGDSSTIILKDNAIGANVSLNDGIYSCYILPNELSANGRLSIKVITEGYSAKVVVPVTRSPGTNFTDDFKDQPIGPFMRVALAREITVKDYKLLDKNIDLISPSPILTLQLSNISNEDNTYTMTWYAVGDDLDKGNATGYDIRYSDKFQKLKTDPEHQQTIHAGIIPKEPGETESFVFRIPNIQTNTTYYIAVRAVDDQNNTGDLSNIISVSILNDQYWFEDEKKKTTNGLSIAFVAGISIGTVIIVFIFLVCFITLIKKRKVPRMSNYAV
ncbi:CLCA3_4 [Mytilus coruscus]|uniref:CLCA3_4 n=1 Tax=Mytilus coruscus TaxID=42192 RepID=A0A6J8EC70_MYTCO|nr:CLCA3_4 [Mytilus coruscus]